MDSFNDDDDVAMQEALLLSLQLGRNQRMQDLFNFYDKDNNQKIDYNEFSRMIEDMLSLQYSYDKVQMVKTEVSKLFYIASASSNTGLTIENFYILDEKWIKIIRSEAMADLGCNNFHNHISNRGLLERIRTWNQNKQSQNVIRYQYLKDFCNRYHSDEFFQKDHSGPIPFYIFKKIVYDIYCITSEELDLDEEKYVQFEKGLQSFSDWEISESNFQVLTNQWEFYLTSQKIPPSSSFYSIWTININASLLESSLEALNQRRLDLNYSTDNIYVFTRAPIRYNRVDPALLSTTRILYYQDDPDIAMIFLDDLKGNSAIFNDMILESGPRIEPVMKLSSFRRFLPPFLSPQPPVVRAPNIPSPPIPPQLDVQRRLSLEEFKQQMPRYGYQFIREVAIIGDGACFFNAVATDVYGSSVYQEVVRSKVANLFMNREYRDENVFLTQLLQSQGYNTDDEIEQYIQTNILEPHVWVDDTTTIQAVSDAYNKEIVIFDDISGITHTFKPNPSVSHLRSSPREGSKVFLIRKGDTHYDLISARKLG